MPDSLIRFGMFDFDVTTRELRRQGQPVRLQAQPAQVLALLLSRGGEVVTRDEIRQAVWGDDTFVDFDRGLNFCIAQIRSALGDSADSPRYVKTLPKRGYQFIAPVAALAASAPALPVRRRVALRRILAPAMLVLVGLMIVLVYRRPGSRQLAFTLAVARFDNETGDPQFDRFADGLTDSVVAELTTLGSGRYGVIGNAAILRLPRDRRDLKAIATTLKTDYVVLGQVQRNDTHIRILVHLIHLPDQTHLAVTRLDRVSPDPLRDELAMAQRIAAEFNRRLGPLPSPGSN
jgi:DNA-binding winged helix-turn-helix (wHTH) protein/TolB-like protein